MSTLMQAEALAMDDRGLLAYMRHMAQTAKPAAAKRVFELFTQREKRRSEVKGGTPFPVSRANGVGGALTPLATVSEGDPVRVTRSGARIERTKSVSRRSDTTKGGTNKKSTGRKGKRVGFQVTAEPGSDVFVAGSFNHWNPRQYRMDDNPGSGHCKTTLILPPGRHEYKFVVNGEWRADSNCAESAPDNQGGLNSVRHV